MGLTRDRLGDVWKLSEEAMGVAVIDMKVWYSIMFDRTLLILFQSDGDIVNIMQGTCVFICC